MRGLSIFVAVMMVAAVSFGQVQDNPVTESGGSIITFDQMTNWVESTFATNIEGVAYLENYNVFAESNRFDGKLVFNDGSSSVGELHMDTGSAKLQLYDSSGYSWRFGFDVASRYSMDLASTAWSVSSGGGGSTFISHVGGQGTLETTNAVWHSEGEAVAGLDIVNYQTMTNALTTLNPQNFASTLEDARANYEIVQTPNGESAIVTRGDPSGAIYNTWLSVNGVDLPDVPGGTIWASLVAEENGTVAVLADGARAGRFYSNVGTNEVILATDPSDLGDYAIYVQAGVSRLLDTTITGTGTISTDASSGTEIVNYQTMTGMNYLASEYIDITQNDGVMELSPIDPAYALKFLSPDGSNAVQVSDVAVQLIGSVITSTEATGQYDVVNYQTMTNQGFLTSASSNVTFSGQGVWQWGASGNFVQLRTTGDNDAGYFQRSGHSLVQIGHTDGGTDYGLYVSSGDTYLQRAKTSHDATNGEQIVNYQTMTGMNYLDKDVGGVMLDDITFTTDKGVVFTNALGDTLRIDQDASGYMVVDGGTSFGIKLEGSSSAFWLLDDGTIRLGTGGDATIGFNGADLVIGSADQTANDEVNFTNFDAYNFDNKIVVGEADLDVINSTGFFLYGGGQPLVFDGKLEPHGAGGDDMGDATTRWGTFYGTGVDVAGNISQRTNDWHYWGSESVNDSWRMGLDGTNLAVQVRVGGSWTNATVFTRP